MIERTVNAGDRVEAGQLLGRLESLNELNALTATIGGKVDMARTCQYVR